MKSAEEWIEELQLEPHQEGGYYKQTNLSEMTHTINGKELPLYTNIYFLLTPESPSHFHQLTSDEMWFYHAGNPLTIHSLNHDNAYTTAILGLEKNQTLHHTVPAGVIFGSSVEEGYALVSCTVVPGFDFADFKLFTKKELLKDFPKHEAIINKLAYDELPE